MDSAWQVMGTTLDREYPFVSHVHPEQEQQTPSRSAHKDSRAEAAPLQPPIDLMPTPLREGTSRNFDTAQEKTEGGRPASLRRQNAVRLTTWQKIQRFLRRFKWNRRARKYRFSRTYLRRKSSFVVTPDISNVNFRFNSRDIAVKQPRPDSWKLSRPIQSWKHANPMAVLSSQQRSQRATQRRPPTAPTPVAPPSENKTRNLNPEDTQGWIKVSLPVRRPSAATSVSSQRPTPVHSPIVRAESSSKRSAGLRISMPRANDSPQAPNSATTIGAVPTAITMSPQTESQDGALKTPSEDSEKIDRNSGSNQVSILAQATTESPTSAPSQYRPVSWRQSALLLRRDNTETRDDVAIEDTSEFVDAWSKYLQRAVAVRAIQHRQRKSWELKQESRWSSIDYSDSDSDGYLSSSHSDVSYSYDSYSNPSGPDSDDREDRRSIVSETPSLELDVPPGAAEDQDLRARLNLIPDDMEGESKYSDSQDQSVASLEPPHSYVPTDSELAKSESSLPESAWQPEPEQSPDETEGESVAALKITKSRAQTTDKLYFNDYERPEIGEGHWMASKLRNTESDTEFGTVRDMYLSHRRSASAQGSPLNPRQREVVDQIYHEPKRSGQPYFQERRAVSFSSSGVGFQTEIPQALSSVDSLERLHEPLPLPEFNMHSSNDTVNSVHTVYATAPSDSTTSVNSGETEDNASHLLQGWYSNHTRSRSMAAAVDRADNEAVLVRQGTLSSNWGAANDSDTEGSVNSASPLPSGSTIAYNPNH